LIERIVQKPEYRQLIDIEAISWAKNRVENMEIKMKKIAEVK